jgi:hypothetical protein
MSNYEAISMEDDWSNLEGNTIDNINEMGAFSASYEPLLMIFATKTSIL